MMEPYPQLINEVFLFSILFPTLMLYQTVLIFLEVFLKVGVSKIDIQPWWMIAWRSVAESTKPWYSQSNFSRIPFNNEIHLLISTHCYVVHRQFYSCITTGLLSQRHCMEIKTMWKQMLMKVKRKSREITYDPFIAFLVHIRYSTQNSLTLQMQEGHYSGYLLY